MIIPLPESDLTLNAFYLGSELIKLINKRENNLIVEELLHEFLKGDQRRTPTSFFDTLTFLYTIGFINERRYRILLKDGETQKALF